MIVDQGRLHSVFKSSFKQRGFTCFSLTVAFGFGGYRDLVSQENKDELEVIKYQLIGD